MIEPSDPSGSGSGARGRRRRTRPRHGGAQQPSDPIAAATRAPVPAPTATPVPAVTEPTARRVPKPRAPRTERTTQAPEPRERGLRDLVGAGGSQVGISRAMRARDVNRPNDDDVAAAERDLVLVRRNWKPKS